MLHALERVVSDVLLIERMSFQNEIYPRAKYVSLAIWLFGVEENWDFNFGFLSDWKGAFLRADKKWYCDVNAFQSEVV